TMFVWLGVSVIVARWLAGRTSTTVWSGASAWAAVTAAAILLLPNESLPNLHQPIHIPPFFTTGQFRGYLAPGETIMIIHGPKDDGVEMLWQAERGFSFRVPQG